MRTFSALFIVSLLIFAAACQHSDHSHADHDHDHDGHSHDHDKTTAEADGKHFGETITADNSISFEEMLGKISESDSLKVKVAGKVDAVCQAKGCWMTIASDTDNEAEMMVKFKDYGFFVPKNISGRTVVMEGYAYREVTPVDELRHYAEDEGKSAEEIAAITEPKEELKFLASGVLLMDE